MCRFVYVRSTAEPMTEITISDISVRYGPIIALRGFTLRVEPGEFMVLVGGSGCGKTSTLRAVAGLEQPVAGDIAFGSRSVFSATHQIDVSPAKRGVGMVFQSYALYPHMTVAQNIGFPLRTRGWRTARRAPAVAAALETVELSGFEHRVPRELSGGQRQRVALARALVSEPSVLLFDEPLSSVDAKLRVSLRADLKRLHRRIGATSLYVTHDIAEAMALGDRIAAMFEGVVHQVGTPDEVYAAPETLAVAALFGARGSCQMPAVVREAASSGHVVQLEGDPRRELPLPVNRSTYAGQHVMVDLRAEGVKLLPERSRGLTTFPVTVTARHPHGERDWVSVTAPGSSRELVASGASQRLPDLGEPVQVGVSAANVYDAGTERLIVSRSQRPEAVTHQTAGPSRSALVAARS